MRIDAKLSGIPLDPLVGSWENEIVRRAQVDGGYKNFDAVSTNVQVPGFFSGLAGIAMSLLEASEGIRYLATALSVGLLRPLG